MAIPKYSDIEKILESSKIENEYDPYDNVQSSNGYSETISEEDINEYYNSDNDVDEYDPYDNVQTSTLVYVDPQWGTYTEKNKTSSGTGSESSWNPLPTKIVPSGKVGDWPKETTESLMEYYGNVGENQTRITLPYPMRLAWNTSQTVKTQNVHKKVADSAVRVLTRVLNHYGIEQIKELGLDLYAGGLNVRKITGGNRYSTHSWGCAFDFDSANNKLKWNSSKARFAKPIYNKWWEIWEEEGWYSLGRQKDYDWMHIQACYRE